MTIQQTKERIFYKSIVTAMILALPVSAGLGLTHGNLVLGLIAGNSIGLLVGGFIGFLLNKRTDTTGPLS
ncbi:MAG: hypothetical protein JJU37_11930 [Balneolaceae bacterium]|nr:hypothetical protein [Balneolaceae bacterium]